MIPILPFIFAISSIGILSLSATMGKFVKKKLKFNHVKEILIILCLIAVIVPNLQFGRISILYSADSYSELSSAGSFLRGNLDEDQIIITNDAPHVTYYSEMQTVGFPQNMTALYSLLEENDKINVLLISFFETVPNYVNEFVNNTNFLLLDEYEREGSPAIITLLYLSE
jgi:hypothetical protein